MTLYGTIVLIHILAAIVGLGASFAMPVVTKFTKTAEQARYALEVNAKIEIFPKIGSLTLLATGLFLGYLNSALFSEVWYISSLVIYVLAQILVIGIIPKKQKQMGDILAAHEGEKLPEAYRAIDKQLDSYRYLLYSLAVVMIILMVVKPF
ncbi:DUF2269 family protein [Fictibacillus phosphorivorans]|uniref:DUF2269 family protein n=1 Tax=Fictibacillus phosphorivorans TaxID=1221500 RepID=UPI0020400505|nr:DUF2269 family protein [Fictibacillus phosphorivorans]MCM3719936.1 DUF2269 domain-containing protein [Fictibacillus phosphorivorans]MCM3777610.1 DUF2269 domain-containing protein [Fictibacillus phosphorivorans]